MKNSFTIFFCTMILCTAAHAQEQAQSEYASARLIEGKSKPQEIDAGLHVDLQEGWYTYWRMPGDAGLAPSFDWSKSENVKDVQIAWPAPKRITVQGMHSFGYDGAVLFPLTVTPSDPSAQTVLNIKLDIVVCHEICVPQTLNVSRPLHGKPDNQDIAVLKKARKALPAKEDAKNLQIGTAVLGKDSVVITAMSKNGFSDGTDMFIETPHSALTAPPEIIPDVKDKTRAVLKIRAPENLDIAKELFGQKTIVTLINGGDAVEKEFTF